MISMLQVQDATETGSAGDQPFGWTFAELEREVALACDEFGAAKLTIAVPVPLDEDTVRRLLAMPQVESIVLAEENADLARGLPERLGWIHAHGRRWRLPGKMAGAAFFLGPRSALTFEIGLALAGRGVFRLLVRTSLGRARIRTVGMGAKSALSSFLFQAARSGVRRVGFGVPTGRVMLWAYRTLIVREKISQATKPFLLGQRPPLMPREAFVPGRVMLVNSALAWGGAERQLVNTAVGLTSRGVRDVTILCDNSAVPDHDFFRWRLDEAGIDVKELRREGDMQAADGDADDLKEVLGSLNFFGLSFGNEVGLYVREILESRPEIVHAWQDHTSVKVGIAAAIVGVPKIVLSARNVAPYNFRYDLPYLRGAYRALLRGKNIVFLNNSFAGATDYATWLNAWPGRIRVIHNGFDFDTLARGDEEAQRAFRMRSGIPDGVRVVGSVFRLYEEKDPLLWIRSAALIAKARSDVVFLIVGTGLMHAEVIKLAEELGIGDRVFLPGTERNPAAAYGLMDVFLLTSRFEGLPNVVIEAQSLGIPVVATEAGGTREAVLDGETGFVVKKREPQALARKVLHVLDNPGWAGEARRIAPEFIRKRFGMDRMIDETLDVYGWARSSSVLPTSTASGARDAREMPSR